CTCAPTAPATPSSSRRTGWPGSRPITPTSCSSGWWPRARPVDAARSVDVRFALLTLVAGGFSPAPNGEAPCQAGRRSATENGVDMYIGIGTVILIIILILLLT